MSTDGVFGGHPRRDGFLLLVVGCVVLAGAWFQYEDLTALESGARESVRMNMLMRFLYNAFGKWGVVATLFSAGCLSVVFGIKALITGR